MRDPVLTVSSGPAAQARIDFYADLHNELAAFEPSLFADRHQHSARVKLLRVWKALTLCSTQIARQKTASGAKPALRLSAWIPARLAG